MVALALFTAKQREPLAQSHVQSRIAVVQRTTTPAERQRSGACHQARTAGRTHAAVG